MNLLRHLSAGVAAIALTLLAVTAPAIAQAPDKQPNIVFIMGDDIGWFNIGAYHQGIMAGRTPNLDQLAAEGMRFTDYYAEASCTAGRANFITGELPIRTGLTTVGQAGSPIGMPGAGADDRHRAQVDGLRHRPVRQEPPGRPERVPAHGARLRRVLRLPLSPRRDGGPVPSATTRRRSRTRSVRATWSTAGRPTRTTRPCSRAGARSASRRSRTRARSIPKRMETVDDEILDHALKFVDKAQEGRQAVLPLAQPDAHARRHAPLGQVRERCARRRTAGRIQEAGMAQLDDIVGSVMKYLKDNGLDDNTIVVFTTDNGAENFTWPDGGQTPFAGGKGTALEGGFRVPAIIRWPGKVPAGKVENGIVSGLDWFPTFVAAAGNPNIVEELQEGQAARRHDLQGPSRRLQPDGPDHRQGPVEAPRDLLLHREHARRGADRRLQVPLHRSAERLARRARSRSTGRSWSTSGSIRSSAPACPTARTRVARLLQLVRLRVLALRVRAAGGRRSSRRPSSSSRRCRRARASTSRPSRRRSRRPRRRTASKTLSGQSGDEPRSTVRSSEMAITTSSSGRVSGRWCALVVPDPAARARGLADPGPCPERLIRPAEAIIGLPFTPRALRASRDALPIARSQYTSAAVAATSASAAAAASASAAAAAKAAAPPPPPPAPAGGPVPIGTVVQALPPGCVPAPIKGVRVPGLRRQFLSRRVPGQ